ncbi:hypothetical protein [Methanolobus sp. WCC5]|uniref:hypothetical protein n=1 Tax=Methanolobus sp. WCC5 TaxID=3125785 RepID=UPI00324E2F0D
MKFELNGKKQKETRIMNKFWQNWLAVWCAAIGLFGVVLAGGALDATSGLVKINFALLNGPGVFELDAPMRFSLAVMGSVTIGWSLAMFAALKAANQLDKRSGKSVWSLMTLSVGSWYVIDSLLSIATGFWLNIIPNTVFMAAFLLPVIKNGVLKQ